MKVANAAPAPALPAPHRPPVLAKPSPGLARPLPPPAYTGRPCPRLETHPAPRGSNPLCRRTKGSGQSLWVLLTLHPPPRTGQRGEGRGRLRLRALGKGADAVRSEASASVGGRRPEGTEHRPAGAQLPPTPAPGEGGAGQPSQSNGGGWGGTWVPAETTPLPYTHTHTPWAAAAGELGWGRQDSSANRSRSRKLRATHPGGRRRAHPALPSPARGGLLWHFCRRAHSGGPQTCTPIAARVPQAGALLETMSTHFRLCTCSVLGTSL